MKWKGGLCLSKRFVLKVINIERKILTHYEIIDRIVEQIVSVCKEPKLWIQSNLRRPEVSFTYSSKFAYFCIVDI